MGNQIFIGPSGSGAETASLASIMRGGAQRILRSASDLTAREQQLLYDFSRPDRAHYPLKPLARFLELAPRAAAPDAVWIAEAIRGLILEQMPLAFVGVLDAFENEQRANWACDVAQFRYLHEARRDTRDAVRDELLAQWVATRLALDAVHLDAQRQRSTFSILK